MKYILASAVAVTAVLVAACGGGGSSPAPSVPAAAAPSGVTVATAGPVSGTRGTITLAIPASTTVANARHAQFVSSGSNSAVVSVNGGGAVVYDVSSGSSLCSTAGGVRTCTISIGVPPGTTSVSVTLTLFQGNAGNGNQLGSGTGSTTIPTNATSFSVPLVVSPIVAGVSFSLAFPSTGIPRISYAHNQTGTNSGTATLTYTDPSGATISNTSTSPFITPVALTVVDPSSTVSISPATVTNAAQVVKVSYTGGTTLGASVTFNAAAGGPTIGTLVSKTSGFMTNFPLAANRRPNEIVVGFDNFLWFTETTGQAIGRMNPADGTFTEKAVPNAIFSPNPLGITAGPPTDPEVWFTIPFKAGTSQYDYFASMPVPAGTPVAQTYTGVAGSQPGEIAAIDGNIWISLQGTNQMRVVDLTGTTLASPQPPGGTSPQGIALANDGNIWVAGNGNGTLNAFSPTLPYPFISSVTVPSGAGAQPLEIIEAPDNALWFTEQVGNAVGRMPVGGPITEFSLTTAGFRAPYAITKGPVADGGIWFTSSNTAGTQGQIVRIDPTTHVIVGYTMTTTTQASFGIVAGPDGNLWATDFSGSAIVRIQP